MREQPRSAERPNEEQSDEWLDRIVMPYPALSRAFQLQSC